MLSREDKQSLKAGLIALAIVLVWIALLVWFGARTITLDNDAPHTPSEWDAKR